MTPPPSNKIGTRRRNIVVMCTSERVLNIVLHLPGVKRVARDAVSTYIFT